MITQTTSVRGIPKYYCIPYLSVPRKLLLSLSDLAWLEPELWGSQKLLISWKSQGSQAGFLLYLTCLLKVEILLWENVLQWTWQTLLSVKLDPVSWAVSPHARSTDRFWHPWNKCSVEHISTNTNGVPSGWILFSSQALSFYLCKLQRTDRNSFLNPYSYHREKIF